MINVVAFLIENFADIRHCPAGSDLEAVLENAGFDHEEIDRLLLCLQLLEEKPETEALHPQSPLGLRVYTDEETALLPAEIRSLLYFLELNRAVDPAQREFVVHALMYLPEEEITLENAKLLALLVLWAHRSELPVLIGDELMAVLHGNGTMH